MLIIININVIWNKYRKYFIDQSNIIMASSIPPTKPPYQSPVPNIKISKINWTF